MSTNQVLLHTTPTLTYFNIEKTKIFTFLLIICKIVPKSSENLVKVTKVQNLSNVFGQNYTFQQPSLRIHTKLMFF